MRFNTEDTQHMIRVVYQESPFFRGYLGAFGIRDECMAYDVMANVLRQIADSIEADALFSVDEHVKRQLEDFLWNAPNRSDLEQFLKAWHSTGLGSDLKLSVADQMPVHFFRDADHMAKTIPVWVQMLQDRLRSNPGPGARPQEEVEIGYTFPLVFPLLGNVAIPAEFVFCLANNLQVVYEDYLKCQEKSLQHLLFCSPEYTYHLEQQTKESQTGTINAHPFRVMRALETDNIAQLLGYAFHDRNIDPWAAFLLLSLAAEVKKPRLLEKLAPVICQNPMLALQAYLLNPKADRSLLVPFNICCPRDAYRWLKYAPQLSVAQTERLQKELLGNLPWTVHYTKTCGPSNSGLLARYAVEHNTNPFFWEAYRETSLG